MNEEFDLGKYVQLKGFADEHAKSYQSATADLPELEHKGAVSNFYQTLNSLLEANMYQVTKEGTLKYPDGQETKETDLTNKDILEKAIKDFKNIHYARYGEPVVSGFNDFINKLDIKERYQLAKKATEELELNDEESELERKLNEFESDLMNTVKGELDESKLEHYIDKVVEKTAKDSKDSVKKTLKDIYIKHAGAFREHIFGIIQEDITKYFDANKEKALEETESKLNKFESADVEG